MTNDQLIALYTDLRASFETKPWADISARYWSDLRREIDRWNLREGELDRAIGRLVTVDWFPDSLGATLRTLVDLIRSEDRQRRAPDPAALAVALARGAGRPVRVLRPRAAPMGPPRVRRGRGLRRPCPGRLRSVHGLRDGRPRQGLRVLPRARRTAAGRQPVPRTPGSDRMTWLLTNAGRPIEPHDKLRSGERIIAWCEVGAGRWTPGEPETRRDAKGGE
jgi:hypothetical protein